MFSAIETERLLLKNISYEDRDFIFSQFSDDAVNQYLFDAEPLVDMRGADEIIAFYLLPEPRKQHRWILVKKDDGQKIGTCGFHCWNADRQICEVGYDLKAAYWGKGYMQEAILAIVAFARDNMSIRQINACIYPENQRSVALAEKLGFVFYGQSKDYLFKGKVYTHQIYTFNDGAIEA